TGDPPAGKGERPVRPSHESLSVLSSFKRSRSSMPQLLLFLLELLFLPVLTLVYWTVISAGLRSLFPFFGQRLAKLPVPGISALANYRWSVKLDIAHPFSLVLFVCVGAAWYFLMKHLLAGGDRR